jgi:hypothetical protein
MRETHEFELEIDVFGLVSGCIHIGDIGGYQLLPRREQVHVLLDLIGDTVYHRNRSCNRATKARFRAFSDSLLRPNAAKSSPRHKIVTVELVSWFQFENWII